MSKNGEGPLYIDVSFTGYGYVYIERYTMAANTTRISQCEICRLAAVMKFAQHSMSSNQMLRYANEANLNMSVWVWIEARGMVQSCTNLQSE